MVNYGRKVLWLPDRKYFPENENRSFPSEKKVYGCPKILSRKLKTWLS